METEKRFEGQSNFAIFLRTGIRFRHQAGADVEVKFNPWHDRKDGRFTFRGQGDYFGGGDRGGAGRGVSRPRNGNRTASTDAERSSARNDPRDPRNHSVHSVRRGETLASIAASRKGLKVSDLAWLNDISATTPLRVGQLVKVPHQAFLEAGRDAKNRVLALDLYMQTHNGALPPNVAKPPSIDEQLQTIVKTERKNGYSFGIDLIERTERAHGILTLGDADGRSKRNQAAAGKPDRLPGDDGGHFIARRFNGPRDKFNHFAQDLGYNRGIYRKLEDQWAKEVEAGRRVFVEIVPQYEGASRRPYNLKVTWSVDGRQSQRNIPNPGKGKSRGRR